jgi:hypothetical protein
MKLPLGLMALCLSMSAQTPESILKDAIDIRPAILARQ